MNTDVRQLVEETIEIIGVEAPPMLSKDSPALAQPAGDRFYLIGLIGGKDVGKSSFVNALVGQQITAPTSHGAGTEIVIAYAHRDASDDLTSMLNREVPGHFRVHTHSIDRLRRQVLLDLPDIDSIYDGHIETTRRMLRHMLYPIWIQSIEKYADRQPQQLLARVAEGNDPANFLFCLNKVDQLVSREGAQAAAQLRDDYSTRLGKLLKLGSTPRVHMVSALSPDAHDFPQLRAALAQEKSESAVRTSLDLAGKQQTRTVLAWLDAQQISERLARADRVLEDAEELVASRIGAPLLEEVLPALQDDAGHRMSMTEPVMSARMSRWPIVNVVNSLLLPLTSIWRQNVGAMNTDEYLSDVPRLVQSTFAQLQQSQPAAGVLYRENKLWDSMAADAAANSLRRRIASTIDHQRKSLVERVAGRSGIISPLIRLMLTIGAALWFPIIQPLLAIAAEQNWAWRGLDVARLAIQIFSAMYLLQSVGFLLLYFFVLWAILRWDTQRRVNRVLESWKRADAKPSMSLTAQSIEWMDELALPVRAYRDRLTDLSARVEQLRADVGTRRDAA